MSTQTIFNKTLISILAIIIVACFIFCLCVDLKAEPAYIAWPPAKQKVILYEFETNQLDTLKFTYQIINASNKKFGYNIYRNKQMLIHQPSIPALPGNEGFETKKDAIKVAQLVIDKLKHGEMPPTVSIDELKRLRIKAKYPLNN